MSLTLRLGACDGLPVRRLVRLSFRVPVLLALSLRLARGRRSSSAGPLGTAIPCCRTTGVRQGRSDGDRRGGRCQRRRQRFGRRRSRRRGSFALARRGPEERGDHPCHDVSAGGRRWPVADVRAREKQRRGADDGDRDAHPQNPESKRGDSVGGATHVVPAGAAVRLSQSSGRPSFSSTFRSMSAFAAAWATVPSP